MNKKLVFYRQQSAPNINFGDLNSDSDNINIFFDETKLDKSNILEVTLSECDISTKCSTFLSDWSSEKEYKIFDSDNFKYRTKECLSIKLPFENSLTISMKFSDLPNGHQSQLQQNNQQTNNYLENRKNCHESRVSKQRNHQSFFVSLDSGTIEKIRKNNIANFIPDRIYEKLHKRQSVLECKFNERKNASELNRFENCNRHADESITKNDNENGKNSRTKIESKLLHATDVLKTVTATESFSIVTGTTNYERKLATNKTNLEFAGSANNFLILKSNEGVDSNIGGGGGQLKFNRQIGQMVKKSRVGQPKQTITSIRRMIINKKSRRQFPIDSDSSMQINGIGLLKNKPKIKQKKLN